MVCLRHLADYVILDCTSVFEADVFSILAMEMADGYCVWELPICGEYLTSSPMRVCWKAAQTMENI